MSYRIWWLVVVVSVSLACAKTEEVSDTSPTAAAATSTPSYKLTVNFEGLVGYFRPTTGDAVWALLPNADRNVSPAPFSDKTDAYHYPRHYAVLEIDGRNVKGLDQPTKIQIPIYGYNIEVTSPLTAGNPSTRFIESQFGQPTSAAAPGVDKLLPGMLAASVDPKILAARMKLPTTDLKTYLSTRPPGKAFATVNPPPPARERTFCAESTASVRNQQRVELVTWSPTLTSDIELTFSPLKPGDSNFPKFTLTLHPETPGKDFTITVANKMAESLMDPAHNPAHWAAYRWFYNLSNSGKNCTDHYYPDGVRGGNRCPQKLYWE